MSNWFFNAVGFGFGAALGGALVGEVQHRPSKRSEPIKQLTEEEILAGERRLDEEQARHAEAERARGEVGPAPFSKEATRSPIRR